MSAQHNSGGLAGGAASGDPRMGDAVDDLTTRHVMPAVAKASGAGEALGLVGGALVVGLLGAVTLWSMNSARQAGGKPALVAPSSAPMSGAAQAPMGPPAVPPQAITIPQRFTPIPPAAGMAGPAVAAAAPANGNAAPTVIFDASSGAVAAVGAPVAGTPAGASGAGNGNEEFAARIGGVGGAAATAVANIDPKNTVTQGTLIPAVLETAIDTDVPGYVRAVVSGDVRSFDGSRVLVPRSSRLIGQYKSGLQAGQKRTYVIWTRLIRPDGVSVNIGSPAIGFSGETGLAGRVDNHFFERFGSAMLLSVVGGLTTLASNNSGLVIAGSGQSAAAAAVNQTGQIGPTIRVRQGQPIRVFTARDLDFSKVGG